MSVIVAPLDLASPEFARWCEIYAVGRAADSGDRPDPGAVAAWARGATDTALLTARVAGTVVGVASVGTRDAHARLYVDGPARRRGVGRALATAVIERTVACGHSRLTATVVAGGPGEWFASALGGVIETRLVTVARRLTEPVPAVATPSGVTLVHWRTGVPEELLTGYALLRRAIADAPEWPVDVESMTGTWVREWERTRTATGHELWVSAAVHDGQLVAFTEAGIPEWGGASQYDTAVLAHWRGRGLATRLKADLLTRLRTERPTVDTITSTINAANTPMLTVCARLGFREVWRRLLVAWTVAA